MHKKILLILALTLLSGSGMVFADENLTITTYYPSPYGSYNRLEVHRGVTYKPLTTQPTTNLQEGELVYVDTNSADTTPGQFSYYGGGKWNPTSSDIPSGAVMYFNLAACPTGWTELLFARGRYLVGLPSGGTRGGTAGIALTNLENRPVGQHNHQITDQGHAHNIDTWDAGGGSGISRSDDKHIDTRGTHASTTGITINNAGTVAGTNAPYLQLLACQKDGNN